MDRVKVERAIGYERVGEQEIRIQIGHVSAYITEAEARELSAKVRRFVEEIEHEELRKEG